MSPERLKTILLFFPSFLFKTVSLINLLIGTFFSRTYPKTLIISVDNLSFGGTGKTPLVKKLSRFISTLGLKQAILLRGYKGEITNKNPLIVKDNHKPEDVGDEAIIYRNERLAEDIIVCTKRERAVEKAIERGNRVLIVDDGFQSRSFKKDITIMLINPDHPFFYLRNFGFLSWWEDIVLCLSDSKKKFPYTFDGTYSFRSEGFKNLKGETVSIGEEPITGFSALGDNYRFEKVLSSFNLKSFIPFKDHHTYTEEDLKNLGKRLKEDQSHWLVCTEKDAVKLRNMDTEGLYVVYLQNEMEYSYNLEETVIEHAKGKGII